MTLSEIPDPLSGKPTSTAVIFKQQQTNKWMDAHVATSILKHTKKMNEILIIVVTPL